MPRMVASASGEFQTRSGKAAPTPRVTWNTPPLPFSLPSGSGMREVGHVLAEDDDALVLLHLLDERAVDQVAHGDGLGVAVVRRACWPRRSRNAVTRRLSGVAVMWCVMVSGSSLGSAMACSAGLAHLAHDQRIQLLSFSVGDAVLGEQARPCESAGRGAASAARSSALR